MDQPRAQPPDRTAGSSRPRPGTPNRYELPWTSMLGALLVVLGVIAVFVVWRAVNRDNESTPVQTVDYQSWLRSVRTDGRLVGFAPEPMPRGWRATSASYTAGASPHWHLGVLTDGRKYVGVEEGLETIDDQVQRYVDEDASRGRDVTIGGARWQTWTDSGGDYAVVRRVSAPKGKMPETLVVVGSAPPAQVRSYAASLRGR